MATFNYTNGTVSASTTASVLFVSPVNTEWVLLHNRGDQVVYLGDSTVTADDSSTGGLQISAGEKLYVPTVGGNNNFQLYGVTESGTSKLSFLTIP